MTRASIQAKVAARKEARPDLYCKHPRCLWRTTEGYCPRHKEGK